MREPTTEADKKNPFWAGRLALQREAKKLSPKARLGIREIKAEAVNLEEDLRGMRLERDTAQRELEFYRRQCAAASDLLQVRREDLVARVHVLDTVLSTLPVVEKK
jgi:vacuolar-type H+-ATPase subunit E/Vma4